MNGNNIKNIRQDLGLTLKELGKSIGVGESTMCNYENNQDSIPIERLVYFANKYKYSLDYITGLSKENNYTKLRKPEKEILGKRLKSTRNTLNLTEESLAKICSIAQGTISNYERGKTQITALNLYTICLHFNLSMDDFLKF